MAASCGAGGLSAELPWLQRSASLGLDSAGLPLAAGRFASSELSLPGMVEVEKV